MFNSPSSWSGLNWHQLTSLWRVKILYGQDQEAARAKALLSLVGLDVVDPMPVMYSFDTGERLYLLQDKKRKLVKATARSLAYLGKTAIPWFDFPYGDNGEAEEKNEKGEITKPYRRPVSGYVSPMNDAMILPISEVIVRGCKVFPPDSRLWLGRHFALPQVACMNISWQQYRALQNIVPGIFDSEASDIQRVELQSQFLAHMLVPRSLSLLNNSNNTIKVMPHYEYVYNADRAEALVGYWRRAFRKENARIGRRYSNICQYGVNVLFHICFQAFQTALVYYNNIYPDLFSHKQGGAYRDALAGEASTINSIMKYASYTDQQSVYDSNLPFVLDILNTMVKEAKEIEKMNAKIKRK